MPEGRTPSSNIYTVLALIALLALLIGVVYVWIQSATVFRGANPFTITAAADLARSLVTA